MKKFVSILLAFVLVFSMTATALAATVTPSADKTLVHAGETVKVTLSLDEAIADTITVAYKLYFNANLFDATSCETGAGAPTVTMSKVKTNATGTYVNLSTMDTTSQGQTLPAGALCTVTFTAKADVTEQTAQFVAEQESIMLKDFTMPDNGKVENGTISVTVKPEEVKAYTASLTPATQSVTCGDNANVTVNVGATGYTNFNALDMTFTYDADKLSFNKAASTIDAAYTVSDNAGTLRILGFGADKALGEAFKLAFTTKTTGEAVVTLTAAKIDESANAGANAPDATIENAEARITVKGYDVTLPADFDGAPVAEPNQDYTFTAKDKNYDFTFTGSTRGGADVEVIDNGDGTYTVKNVTGSIVITATKKGKQYPVTVTGSGKTDITVADFARYGEDFTFSHDNLETDAYDYTLTMTIGGKDVTPELLVDMGDSRIYSVSGAEITGDIVINAEKTPKAPKTTSISFTGSGSADVKGGTTQTATNGQDFQFELNKADGYDYTVKLGEDELTAGADGKYTIPAAKLTGEALTVTVEKTAQQTLEINVSEYVKLDGTTMWLVTASGTVSDGKILAYDGTPMFWSEKYNAYTYLVISDKPLADVKAEAETKVAEATADKTDVTYDFDVNETTMVDVNDAQLVYNMYNAKYASFDEVAMVRFLKADCNGDKVLNVLDANAVIAEIMK